MKEEDREILKSFRENCCYFCGNRDENDDYTLFGIEAHKKNPLIKIIKMCYKCESDWISTYRR